MRVKGGIMLRRFYLALIISLLAVSSLTAATDRDALFQRSTIDALMIGLYDGSMSFRDLKTHGDTGIGTLDALDGEMIALDGKFYQIASDGICRPVADSMTTPFASVTCFERDKVSAADSETGFESLKAMLDTMMPSKNVFYAIRIDGTFRSVKTRSVPKQTKPYPKLTDVVAKQPTFEFTNAKGTLIGFWCPYYVKGVNVPGYHFHFITEDRTQGGHLLDCATAGVTAYLDVTPRFSLSLPTSDEFLKAPLGEDTSKDLKTVEQGK
jgi:acetolactate decarboxylase